MVREAIKKDLNELLNFIYSYMKKIFQKIQNI